MIEVTHKEFIAFLGQKENKLAIPDGFTLVGSTMQTKWVLNGEEIARSSQSGNYECFEIKSTK